MRTPLAPALALAAALWGGAAAAESWEEVRAQARGQTVYFNAWAGDERINAYIAWAGERLKAEHGVTLQHVKVADTGAVVGRILAEKTAGRSEGGSVDLVWINGENFKAMKDNGLLSAPFAQSLPNWRYVDTEGKPTTLVDFTVPTEGRESPWGMAQLVFMHDTARVPRPPRSLAELADWARANPGRFTYPAPPDFIGSTFLKQALIDLAPDPKRLAEPATDADFDAATAPLWAFLDGLKGSLWRRGEGYPATSAAFRQLLADGEIDIAFSFNPGDASSAIAQGLLPETVRSFVFEGGTIGNTHFLAVPFNAKARAGALVAADFLLSPEAQAQKEDPRIWGDPTVLAMTKLSPEDRQRFAALPRGAATLDSEALGRPLPEPHPSWMERLEREWARRHAK